MGEGGGGGGMIFVEIYLCLCGVSDPFHFDTAQDPLIRLLKTQIRIRPKIENIPTFYNLFLF